MSAIIKWNKPAASLDREPEHLRPEMARLQKLWLKWWTDEQALRQVLNEYLPGRSWENVGKI